jgi:hypothetical protein
MPTIRNLNLPTKALSPFPSFLPLLPRSVSMLVTPAADAHRRFYVRRKYSFCNS